LTPGEVEKALKEIFRYAQLWDCVLLLDEADIFLAQRSKNDITRNSLVSGEHRLIFLWQEAVRELISRSLSASSGILHRRLVSHDEQGWSIG
jgi:SpoVK/Ycf46/Vps4 family AAA+-type ATPase